jgi:hypothetical protein
MILTCPSLTGWAPSSLYLMIRLYAHSRANQLSLFATVDMLCLYSVFLSSRTPTRQFPFVVSSRPEMFSLKHLAWIDCGSSSTFPIDSPWLGGDRSCEDMTSLNLGSASLRYKNLLVVIKQTAFEEYSQLKLRGQAPKALRWKRLEQRYKSHKQCVNDLLGVLRKHDVSFSCVNRVELDRQHLADVDLMVAVGGDGTVLSAAHFLDHGTIPLLGINSDPNVSMEDRKVTKKVVDERRYVQV